MNHRLGPMNPPSSAHAGVSVSHTLVTMRWVWIVLGVWGCSSAADDAAEPSGALSPTGNTGMADSGDAGSTDDVFRPIVGTFAVSLVAARGESEAFTSILGRVYDAPMPSEIEWQLDAEAGDCFLLTPSIPFCDPGCGSSAVCVASDECIPYPTGQDVGTVSVTGLGEAFEMEPIANAYQAPANVDLGYPPGPPGAAVVLSSTGGAYEPFTVRSTSIEPLEFQGPEQLELDPEQALALRWTAPEDPTLTRIQVRMDISHHGGFKGEIDCDLADNGSIEIAAELVARLVELGVAGFPTITVARVATGGTVIEPGRVLLTVSSGVERELLIPGIVSCNDDMDCGTGQTCASDRTCTQ